MAGKAERIDRVRQANHQLGMEGLSPTERSKRNDEAYISGKATLDELREQTLREIRDKRRQEAVSP